MKTTFMEAMEILHGNKLIAHFWGYEEDKRSEGHIDKFYTGLDLGSGYALYSNLQYHSCWDWLMPVIEKIEAMGTPISICGNLVTVGTPSNDSYFWQGGFTHDTKIISAWHGVVQFIKWHNNQQK